MGREWPPLLGRLACRLGHVEIAALGFERIVIMMPLHSTRLERQTLADHRGVSGIPGVCWLDGPLAEDFALS